MKVLLIVSPNFSIKMLEEEINNIKKGSCDFTKSVDWRPSPPLGILYIAGSLRKAGCDVQIYDLHRAFYICKETGYFKEKDLSNFFEDYFESVLKADKIDILGISCLFNVSSSTVKEMGIRCKNISPSIKIVIGGHYPTIMYHQFLKEGICDYVILGEAEEEFVWLANNLSDPLIDKKINKNPHIVSPKCIDNPDKKATVIKDLDSLAKPAWDLLPNVVEYIDKSINAERIGSTKHKKNVKSASVFTTRGCPMMCTFCASHGVHGRVIRAHSINYMLNHIDWLVEKYNINNLVILDDMFNFSPNRVIDFCNTLVKKYPNHFNLEFPSGMAVWLLNEEVIISLKKAGLKTITIAIESGSPYIQKHILKKNLDLSVVKEKVDLLKKHNIGVRAFYIVGFVGETLEMIENTVNFALNLNIDWSEIKVLTPLVGSEMYDLAKEKGYITGDTSEHVFGRSCVETPEFSAEDVKRVQYDANIRVNFLHNRFLIEKKYKEAESIFLGLLRRFPNHLFAQYCLWQALKGQGKIREAEEALVKLHQLSDKSENSNISLKKYKIKLPPIKEY